MSSLMKIPLLTLSVSPKKLNDLPRIFSNQLNHLEQGVLNDEGCAFVYLPALKSFAVYNKHENISCRLLHIPSLSRLSFNESVGELNSFYTFSLEEISKILQQELFSLTEKKEKLFPFIKSECFRLCHGEADGFPDLVIDHYRTLIVIQSMGPCGDILLQLLKGVNASPFNNIFNEIPVLEKSTSQQRKMGGHEAKTETLSGTVPNLILSRFCGEALTFSPLESQKSGLFLDQRSNLQLFKLLIGTNPDSSPLSPPLSMLDICCYVGAWSSIAASSGVKSFSIIDQDDRALALAQNNISNAARRFSELTKLSPLNSELPLTVEALKGDMFEILKTLKERGASYDIVVADPPAFTRSKKDVSEARRAYARLFSRAASLVKAGGLLVTASCSRHIESGEFKELVISGLSSDWILVGVGSQSPDHTIPAVGRGYEYLKALFFRKRL